MWEHWLFDCLSVPIEGQPRAKWLGHCPSSAIIVISLGFCMRLYLQDAGCGGVLLDM